GRAYLSSLKGDGTLRVRRRPPSSTCMDAEGSTHPTGNSRRASGRLSWSPRACREWYGRLPTPSVHSAPLLIQSRPSSPARRGGRSTEGEKHSGRRRGSTERAHV